MFGHTITCLLGDDHEALRKGVAALLESEDDIRVVGQGGAGPDTLALLERRKPDVLIVDMRMPGMDGIEVCRHVAEHHAETKTLIYTGYDDLEIVDLALDAGASGYMLKTAPPPELIRAVRLVKDDQTYIDPSLAGQLLHRRSGAPANPLSPREVEVLCALAHGMTTEGAAKQLFLSPTTVRSYAENAMHKLDAHNRVHAVAVALRSGLIA